MNRPQIVGWVVLAMIALFTVLGLVALWPDGRQVIEPPSGAGPRVESATVADVEEGGCRAGGTAPVGARTSGCRRITVEVTSGPDTGEVVGFDLGGTFDIAAGDDVRVSATDIPVESVGGVAVEPYSFSDFERRPALLLLGIAFALLVVITARLKGLRALGALGASLALILMFIIPSIIDGNPPVSVALFGALAIMLITIGITHGVGVVASAAALGTTIALGIAVALASLVTGAAHITGFAQEDAVLLAAGSETLSVRGLLIAGMVIGALGVLDDLTISQASTVMALRASNPLLSGRDLFRRALGVGHDHVVATINTLALAYVGAALPILLIFSVAGTGFSDAINSETVATEIAAAAVGGIALMLASPITTALAAVLATNASPDELGDAAAGHHH